MGALENILVVELDCGMAGALAGMLLCDNGARVVKVESRAGVRERRDQARHPGHRVWNRGKESLVVDVLQPDGGVNVLKHWLARADVLIHPFLSERARSLGLDFESLAAINPRLIICSISGYGSQGPLAGLPANDALVAARFGLSSSQPGWYPGPSYIAHPIASIGAALLAVQGICAALFAREASGRGQAIETSLLGGLYAMTTYSAGEKVRKARTRWKAIGSAPFYSMYECADGRWLHFGCIHRGFARKAIEAIGIADVFDEPRFGDGFGLQPGEAEDELFARVSEAMKSKPFAEWARLLEAADVPFAPVQDGETFMDDPQGRVNGIVQIVDPEVGLMEQMGLPIYLSDTPGQVKGPAPRLGQHDGPIADSEWPIADGTRVNRGQKARGYSAGGRQVDQRPSAISDQPSTISDQASANSDQLSTISDQRSAISDQPSTISDQPSAISHSPSAISHLLSASHHPPPLKGIRVLEIANVIAGPMAGRFLADLGAEVIKLESPDGGDIARRNGTPAFLALNSGKQGIAVDLRQPAGQEIGRRLACWADVLIDNMRPGVAEKLGMGWERLRSTNPGLIYCHVTGFGSRGPYAHKPGLDPLAGALTGIQMAQGAYCGKPVFLLVAAVDHATALLACHGILLALLARARTGKGQRVETNLLNAAALINAHALTRYDGKAPRTDLPRTQYGLHALHRLYEAADGWLCITVESDAQWEALCYATGKGKLLADARFATASSRLHHDEALSSILAETFGTRNVADWITTLELAGVPCAPVVEDFANQFFADAQSIANGMIVEHEHPALGTVRLAHRWLQFSETPIQSTTPTPLLGQHTREVLAQLGYLATEIEALREQAVVLLGDVS